MLKNLFKRAGIPTAFGLATTSAFATAPTTIAELSGSVSFADVGLGILAVAGAALALYVIWKGAKFTLAAVKSA